MGCLNSEGQFEHWFGNIHFSGPCNRSCYFCIGQHMMALDSYNNLNEWPLRGFDQFKDACYEKDIWEINLTGTNTDPMLYRHADLIKNKFIDCTLGIRTNGVSILALPDRWRLFDKASISYPSKDPAIYEKIMGGPIINLDKILKVDPDKLTKINIVLTPYTCGDNRGIAGGIFDTLAYLESLGIERVNLREPYGQPHIGNPLGVYASNKSVFGMPCYNWLGMEITYWDVHYCEVESVNLYADGTVSIDYPITRGHSPTGTVKDQSNFKGGRIQEQWIQIKH